MLSKPRIIRWIHRGAETDIAMTIQHQCRYGRRVDAQMLEPWGEEVERESHDAEVVDEESGLVVSGTAGQK